MKTVLKTVASKMPSGVKAPLQSIRDRIRLARYRGDACECPVCSSKLRRFAPHGASFPVFEEQQVVGGGFREQALCPVCWANDRERLLYKFITSDEMRAPYEAKILHVAAESMIRTWFGYRDDITYVTADYMREYMDAMLDIQILPFADDTFDLIICNHVMEHVDDDALAMREFNRVMKPGARAIVQVPIALALDETYENKEITDPRARELAFGQNDHVRLYGRDYGAKLQNAGFDLDKIQWCTRPDIFGENAERYGFHPEEDLYVVRKV